MIPTFPFNKRFWMTLLICCWQTVSLSATNESCYTSSSDWIRTPVPLYYVIGLAALLLLTLVSCIACLRQARRRRNQDLNDELEQVERINPEREPNNTKYPSHPETAHPPEKHVDETANQPGNCDDNDESSKTNGVTPSKDTMPQSSEESPNEGNIEPPVWEPRVEQDPDPDSGNEANQAAAPLGEPLYAEVNKNKKTKEKIPSSVVYAELADFNLEKRDSHESQALRQNTDYAQITRLAMSPRDMSPLDC